MDIYRWTKPEIITICVEMFATQNLHKLPAEQKFSVHIFVNAGLVIYIICMAYLLVLTFTLLKVPEDDVYQLSHLDGNHGFQCLLNCSVSSSLLSSFQKPSISFTTPFQMAALVPRLVLLSAAAYFADWLENMLTCLSEGTVHGKIVVYDFGYAVLQPMQRWEMFVK